MGDSGLREAWEEVLGKSRLPLAPARQVEKDAAMGGVLLPLQSRLGMSWTSLGQCSLCLEQSHTGSTGDTCLRGPEFDIGS